MDVLLRDRTKGVSEQSIYKSLQILDGHRESGSFT